MKKKAFALFLLSLAVFSAVILTPTLQSFFAPKKSVVVTQEEAATNFGQSYPAKLVNAANTLGVEGGKIEKVKRLHLEILTIKDEKLIDTMVKENDKELSLLMLEIKKVDMENVLRRYGESIENDPKKEERIKVARIYLKKELRLLPLIIDATEALRLAKISGDKAEINASEEKIEKFTDELYVKNTNVEGIEDFDTSTLSIFATQL